MDIIASHQHGLVEQLEIEAAALAGSIRDRAQRAIVYHHLADSLGLANVHALLAAHATLGIDQSIATLRRQAARAWWRLRRGERAALIERVDRFGDALRECDRRRCGAALLAYRLIATPGLGQQAKARLDPDLIGAFMACRTIRGGANRDSRRALFVAQQRWSETAIGDAIEAAITELEWPLGPRAVRAAVGALRITVKDYERAERRGLARTERALRGIRSLPPTFASNPAQAFFALQRQLAERRRRAAAAYDELSPEEAVSLAA